MISRPQQSIAVPGVTQTKRSRQAGFGVLPNVQSADDAAAVQALVVVTELVHVVTLLVGEIALDQQLPREVVVPRERPQLARGADEQRTGGCHSDSPLEHLREHSCRAHSRLFTDAEGWRFAVGLSRTEH